MNVDWIDSFTHTPITSIKDMPDEVIGFVYRITYVDNMRYIGKKNLYSIKTKKALQSGKRRLNTIRRINRIVDHHIQTYDVLEIESNWKTYQGSHKEAKIRIPQFKEILEYGFSNLQLTYLEAKWLFSEGVLERDDYINDNILGKFYRNVNNT